MPFPTTAKLLARNYKESVGGAVDRVDMSDGTAKQGRARHFDQRKLSISYLMTAAELTEFKDFHRNDISRGARRFVWTDPVTLVAVDARIVKGEFTAVPVQRFRGCSIVAFILEVFD